MVPQNTFNIIWRYCSALTRYNLFSPWRHVDETKGLISAVLRYDFKRGVGRGLETVSRYDVFPELAEQSWVQYGVRCAAESPLLCGIIQLLEARTVLEIGTYHGGTTLQLAANLPDNGRVITVDVSADQLNDLDIELDQYDAPLAQKSREQIGHLYRNTPHERKITQIIQDSATVDYARYVDHFDLIFVDGGHSYTQIKRDTENALPHLRPGGVICWHDYHAGSHGVTRYLHELRAKFPILHINQTMLAVIRLGPGQTQQLNCAQSSTENAPASHSDQTNTSSMSP